MVAHLRCFILADIVSLGFGIGGDPKAGGDTLETEGPVIEYVYQQDLNREIGVVRGNLIHVGKLDANGKFNEYPKVGRLDADGKFYESQKFAPFLHPLKTMGAMMSIGGTSWGSPINGRDALSILSFGITIINDRVGPAYEYRSGKLIKGVLNAEGNFVPDAGSKLLPFKDYPYGEAALPIYNLPGRFVPRDGTGKKQTR